MKLNQTLIENELSKTAVYSHENTKESVPHRKNYLKWLCLLMFLLPIWYLWTTMGLTDVYNVTLDPDKVFACYYNTPTPNVSRQLQPSQINPHLCTHINVAFASVVHKQIHLDDNMHRTLRAVVQLKTVNPKLKVLLSVGGSSDESGFPEMVADHASRKEFLKSLKYILRKYSLDGVDLDWEFPGRGGHRERQHFSQLLHEIRSEYNREKRDYLLTVAVPAPEIIVNTAYDIDQLNLYTDFVNIMTYDFHFYSRYTPFTGFNAPLYARSSESSFLATLNVNYTVHMYLDKGLSPDKAVVGIPTYGHTFTLVNPNNNGVSSPASGYGSLGGGGFVDYMDVCRFIKKYEHSVIYKNDNISKVPYMCKGREWVSFDTPSSVTDKAVFIKDLNLRGAMVYSLNADDYTGECQLFGDTNKFPLSNNIKNVLVTKQ